MLKEKPKVNPYFLCTEVMLHYLIPSTGRTLPLPLRPSVERLDAGTTGGRRSRWHRCPHPHGRQVITELLAAIQTGDIGMDGYQTGLMDRRDRTSGVSMATPEE
jgi:hypothetical protein